MSKHYPKIQIRRTQIAYSNNAIKNTTLEYGEPLFISTDSYLVIGGSDTNDKKVSAQKIAKLYGKDIIDNSLFFQAVTNPQVPNLIYLINDQKQQLYLVSTGIKRTDGTDIETDLTNIWLELAKKANIIAPTFQKDTTTNAYPSSVTPTTGDNSTKIATTAFVKTALDNFSIIEPKRQDTSSTKLYVCGVTAQDGDLKYCGDNASASSPGSNTTGVYINCKTGVLFGSAWNDFAEFRKCNASAGSVVCETGKGDLVLSSERLQAGAAVVSDTYGMVIGLNDLESKPIAVAGRVLVYFTGQKRNYKAGDAVCAAADGKIDIMTREEIKEYPDRILGYVSEIPSKKTWNNVSTEGRIWIKIK